MKLREPRIGVICTECNFAVDDVPELVGLRILSDHQRHAHPQPQRPCPYCTPQPGDTPESLAHSPEKCPRVAAINYDANGRIKRVELVRP